MKIAAEAARAYVTSISLESDYAALSVQQVGEAAIRGFASNLIRPWVGGWVVGMIWRRLEKAEVCYGCHTDQERDTRRVEIDQRESMSAPEEDVKRRLGCP